MGPQPHETGRAILPFSANNGARSVGPQPHETGRVALQPHIQTWSSCGAQREAGEQASRPDKAWARRALTDQYATRFVARRSRSALQVRCKTLAGPCSQDWSALSDQPSAVPQVHSARLRRSERPCSTPRSLDPVHLTAGDAHLPSSVVRVSSAALLHVTVPNAPSTRDVDSAALTTGPGASLTAGPGPVACPSTAWSRGAQRTVFAIPCHLERPQSGRREISPPPLLGLPHHSESKRAHPLPTHTGLVLWSRPDYSNGTDGRMTRMQ